MASSHKLSRADFPTAPPQRRASDHLCSLSVWQKKPFSEPQFTCVVSKKTAAKAADRNRLKRRCRAALQSLLDDVDSPVIVVAHPKKTVLDAPPGDLKASLRSLLVKLGL